MGSYMLFDYSMWYEIVTLHVFKTTNESTWSSYSHISVWKLTKSGLGVSIK